MVLCHEALHFHLNTRRSPVTQPASSLVVKQRGHENVQVCRTCEIGASATVVVGFFFFVYGPLTFDVFRQRWWLARRYLLFENASPTIPKSRGREYQMSMDIFVHLKAACHMAMDVSKCMPPRGSRCPFRSSDHRRYKSIFTSLSRTNRKPCDNMPLQPRIECPKQAGISASRDKTNAPRASAIKRKHMGPCIGTWFLQGFRHKACMSLLVLSPAGTSMYPGQHDRMTFDVHFARHFLCAVFTSNVHASRIHNEE